MLQCYVEYLKCSVRAALAIFTAYFKYDIWCGYQGAYYLWEGSIDDVSDRA